MRKERIQLLMEALNKRKIWDEEPVFCFTTDIDWASETILARFFDDLLPFDLKLTAFVTHESDVIEELHHKKRISRGIHPNFLGGSSHRVNFPEGSSHGGDFRTVINSCLQFAP